MLNNVFFSLKPPSYTQLYDIERETVNLSQYSINKFNFNTIPSILLLVYVYGP